MFTYFENFNSNVFESVGQDGHRKRMKIRSFLKIWDMRPISTRKHEWNFANTVPISTTKHKMDFVDFGINKKGSMKY